MTTPLFPSSLIPPSTTTSFPTGYIIRPCRRSDYTAGFLDVLRVLTTVGDISESAWNERYTWMETRSGPDGEYFVVVVEEEKTGKVVGTGTLVLEKKFLRNLGVCGHVEDIAVARECQGLRLGQGIIRVLDGIAEGLGCYKAILDCSEKNEGFYVKCGYKKAGIQMAHYYGDAQPKAT